jgi:protein-histidine pros-kinase
MLALYGNDNGFGWQVDEVVGSQIVSVPLSVPLAQAKYAFGVFMISLVGVFVAIFLVVNLILRWIVIKPAREIANLADDISRGNMAAPEFEIKGKDEMALLGTSFNRMRRSLEKAMKMLAD